MLRRVLTWIAAPIAALAAEHGVCAIVPLGCLTVTGIENLCKLGWPQGQYATFGQDISDTDAFGALWHLQTATAIQRRGNTQTWVISIQFRHAIGCLTGHAPTWHIRKYPVSSGNAGDFRVGDEICPGTDHDAIGTCVGIDHRAKTTTYCSTTYTLPAPCGTDGFCKWDVGTCVGTGIDHSMYTTHCNTITTQDPCNTDLRCQWNLNCAAPVHVDSAQAGFNCWDTMAGPTEENTGEYAAALQRSGCCDGCDSDPTKANEGFHIGCSRDSWQIDPDIRGSAITRWCKAYCLSASNCMDGCKNQNVVLGCCVKVSDLHSHISSGTQFGPRTPPPCVDGGMCSQTCTYAYTGLYLNTDSLYPRSVEAEKLKPRDLYSGHLHWTADSCPAGMSLNTSANLPDIGMEHAWDSETILEKLQHTCCSGPPPSTISNMFNECLTQLLEGSFAKLGSIFVNNLVFGVQGCESNGTAACNDARTDAELHADSCDTQDETLKVAQVSFDLDGESVGNAEIACLAQAVVCEELQPHCYCRVTSMSVDGAEYVDTDIGADCQRRSRRKLTRKSATRRLQPSQITAQFTLIEAEEDPAPVQTNLRPEKEKEDAPSLPLLLGLCIGGFLLLTGIIAGIVFLWIYYQHKHKMSRLKLVAKEEQHNAMLQDQGAKSQQEAQRHRVMAAALEPAGTDLELAGSGGRPVAKRPSLRAEEADLEAGLQPPKKQTTSTNKANRSRKSLKRIAVLGTLTRRAKPKRSGSKRRSRGRGSKGSAAGQATVLSRTPGGRVIRAVPQLMSKQSSSDPKTLEESPDFVPVKQHREREQERQQQRREFANLAKNPNYEDCSPDPRRSKYESSKKYMSSTNVTGKTDRVEEVIGHKRYLKKRSCRRYLKKGKKILPKRLRPKNRVLPALQRPAGPITVDVETESPPRYLSPESLIAALTTSAEFSAPVSPVADFVPNYLPGQSAGTTKTCEPAVWTGDGTGTKGSKTNALSGKTSLGSPKPCKAAVPVPSPTQRGLMSKTEKKEYVKSLMVQAVIRKQSPTPSAKSKCQLQRPAGLGAIAVSNLGNAKSLWSSPRTVFAALMSDEFRPPPPVADFVPDYRTPTEARPKKARPKKDLKNPT